jgi:hypothetical protein
MAKCCYADCFYAVSFMLNVASKPFMLSVIVLNGIVLNVIVLNVVVLNVIVLNVTVLNAIVLNVIVLNVMALPKACAIKHFVSLIDKLVCF